MHIPSNFDYKRGLHFSTIAVKLLTAVQSHFKAQVLTQNHEPVPFKCFTTHTNTPTFKTKALRHLTNEGRLKHHLLEYIG